VPQDIVNKLNASVNEVLANKDVVDKLTTNSGIVLKPMSPAQFQGYLDKDIARWKEVVAKGHIQPR
jgi:tripartite-type tricarboxylate transporter receptor subunit TctC